MPRAALVGFLLLAASVPGAAQAQDLVGRFVEARIRRIAREQADRDGVSLVPRPPVELGIPGDTIRAWLRSFQEPEVVEEPPPPPTPPIVVDSIRVVRKLERPAFVERFGSVPWAFYQGRTFSVLDTTRTPELRSRLEAHFGPPTRTLAEVDSVESRRREEVIEFEYWLVVNDSIEVAVLDVNGFLDRGLVFASDSRYRDRMADLRAAVLGRLEDPVRRAAFADYYYHIDSRSWFVSGFDGASFFTRRIVRPDLTRGRPFVGTYAPGPGER